MVGLTVGGSAAEPVLVSPHSLFKLSETSGTTIVDHAPALKQITGDWTYNGSNTAAEAQWTAKPGWLHALSNDAVAAASSSYADLLTLAGLGGQVVVFADMYITVRPTSGQFSLFSSGAWGSTDFIQLYVSSTGPDSIRAYQLGGAGPTAYIAGSIINDLELLNLRLCVMAIWDPARKMFGLFVNGILQESNYVPGTPQTEGWNLRNPTDMIGGNSDILFMIQSNALDTETVYYKRVGMIVTQEDKITQLPALARELYLYDSHNLPMAFNGI